MTLEQRHKDLLTRGDSLFSERQSLVSLWQDLAENFYTERADFTSTRLTGEDFASGLDTSYPILARRDLGNAFGAMLRPPGKSWFTISLKRDSDLDEGGRRWLEMATRVQRRALYDIHSGFVRSTKEGDHDFATFGQCVLSSEPFFSSAGFVLLHRTWHLRDVVWSENSYGKINFIQRKWEPTAEELKRHFKSVHRNVSSEKDKNKKIKVRHTVVSSEIYEKDFKTPWVSVFVDEENDFLLEETGSTNGIYVIPRWETVSGSQYAYSPAAIAALPDARMIQTMTYTLLTAGEYAVEPAMIGVDEAIKSGIELYSGGFTAVDASYDKRLEDVISPLTKGGDRALPFGLEMVQDTRNMIAEAFYLNTLSLPTPGQGGMSPYEVAQRIEEFIRRALPLFEPMETDYNGALMEQDFDILLRAGAFGPKERIPESLLGKETEFRFESPLRESIDRLKGSQFIEARDLTLAASEMDPTARFIFDVKAGLRGALRGVQTPAEWMMSEEAVEEQVAQQAQAEQAVGEMQALDAGVDVVQKMANLVGGQDEES